MPNLATARSAEFGSLIERFLSERLASKLDKLPADDPKRSELIAQFEPATWLADAARRVVQIQAVTHTLKPIHPDAKGSSLFCEPSQLTAGDAVGTHCLGGEFEADVVGNAAALDVHKLLKLSHEGRSLLELAVDGDPDLAAALSADSALGQQWLQAFASPARPRGRPSSHSHAKQLYWLVGSEAGVDAHDDADFHLLAPLYPSSLVQRVYQQLQDDRFSDEAKAARAARGAGEAHTRPVREYLNLAIQKLGGTKPQNISQLNSERRGDNCLLASLPPLWQSADVRAVLGVTDMFQVFGARPAVRAQAQALRRFLAADAAPNAATRKQVRQCLDVLLDELVLFQAELFTLVPGWSLAPECQLPLAQRVCLDPQAARLEGAGLNEGEAADEVAADFARWVNAQLRDPLPVGDAEFLHWRRLARDEFAALAREAA